MLDDKVQAIFRKILEASTRWCIWFRLKIDIDLDQIILSMAWGHAIPMSLGMVQDWAFMQSAPNNCYRSKVKVL